MKRDLLMAHPSSQSDFVSDSRMGMLFRTHDGKPCDKWNHYLDVYDRHLGLLANEVRVLEIGVQRGGSLQLWRRYFGADAVIHGLDVDPACAEHDGEAGTVHVGDQADVSLLRGIVAKMGGLDVVVDDGGHHCSAQIVTLETLFPMLSDGGVYICEDTHTSYWPEYGGGGDDSFVEHAKDLVDNMHEWWHGATGDETVARSVGGIFFYDSMVVLEKRKREPPRRTIAGRR